MSSNLNLLEMNSQNMNPRSYPISLANAIGTFCFQSWFRGTVVSNEIEGKYIFLDIVKYTRNRTVEAQTEIITVLNRIIRESLEYFRIDKKNRILIPTGDGICIALLNINEPHDIHLEMALKILELISKENESQQDPMRRFQIRIGINENRDNLVTDVNGSKNVAGLGINEAQRIMDQADAGNILVGRTVYDRLRQREKYQKKFAGFEVTIKHKQKIDVYQFVDPSISYLNSEILFEAEPKFSKLAAYFIAYLIKNKEFIVQHGSMTNHTELFVLMSYLAKQAANKSESKDSLFLKNSSTFEGKTLEDLLAILDDKLIPSEFKFDYSQMFFETNLFQYTGGTRIAPLKYFNHFCLEPTEEAVKKTKKEWPEIFSEFSIE